MITLPPPPSRFTDDISKLSTNPISEGGDNLLTNEIIHATTTAQNTRTLALWGEGMGE